MSGTVSINSTRVSEVADPLAEYRSRPRQLARWLLASRDALREKYQELKVVSKRLNVRIHDLAKSRDHWKQRAEAADQQIQSMKAEIERLIAQLEQAVTPVDVGFPKKVNCHSVHGFPSHPANPSSNPRPT